MAIRHGAWHAALLPFFKGQPGAVIAMYRDWQARLQKLTALRFPGVRDVRSLRILKVPLPLAAYRAIQVLGGLLVVAWTWRLQRREVPAEWLVSGTFAVTIAYMLALGGGRVRAVPASRSVGQRGGARGKAAIPRALRSRGCLWDDDGRRIWSSRRSARELGRLRAPQSLITLGAIAFGVWVVLKWRRAAPSRDTKGFEEMERAFAKT